MAALREAQDRRWNGGELSAERQECRKFIVLGMAQAYTARRLRPEWLSFQSKPLSKNPDGLYLKSQPSSGCELISRKPNAASCQTLCLIRPFWMLRDAKCRCFSRTGSARRAKRWAALSAST